jgi:hypothetical protein
MPVPRAPAKVSDIDSCGLTFSELQELWLGCGHNGSCFSGEEELREAWDRGRGVCMRLWGSQGRRPQAWWYLEGSALGLAHPGYFREQSYLYAHNVLTEAERTALVDRWKVEFDAVKGKSAQERRQTYEHHDIPAELIEKWQGERRKRTKPSPSAEVPSDTNNAPAGPRTGVAAP